MLINTLVCGDSSRRVRYSCDFFFLRVFLFLRFLLDLWWQVTFYTKPEESEIRYNCKQAAFGLIDSFIKYRKLLLYMECH